MFILNKNIKGGMYGNLQFNDVADDTKRRVVNGLDFTLKLFDVSLCQLKRNFERFF